LEPPFNNGTYGAYFGQLGYWQKWQGCSNSDSGGVANHANLDAAADHNYSAGAGEGFNGYWTAAGPGRKPSTDTPQQWGAAQAARAVADATNVGQKGPFVFFDVEANAGPNTIGNGWHNNYQSLCDSTVVGSVSTTQSDNVFNGWYDYFSNSVFEPAVYSAGGNQGGSYTWPAVFGSKTLSNTNEWTFIDESTYPKLQSSDFPTAFKTPNGTAADFFASAPTYCDNVWQWTGGDGTSNNYGDFDQVDTNSNVCY
jgi:hypothetical protein